MKYKIICVLLSLSSFFLLNACGPKYEFKRARHLEKKGYFVQAGMKYEGIFKKHPENPIAAEALYRAGRIYRDKLKIYPKGSILFAKVMDNFAGLEPWAKLAEESLFDCPDYFPLGEGNFWIEGDSKTGGQNMRSEWHCYEISTGTYKLRKKLMAGRTFVSEMNRFYRKQDLELKESMDKDFNNYTKLLTYPFTPGRVWMTAKDGRKMRCRIIEKSVEVKVAAGLFPDCLKVSEEYPELPGSIKYNYYAPGTGWILTTTAVLGRQEYRSSELISCKIGIEKQAVIPASKPALNLKGKK